MTLVHNARPLAGSPQGLLVLHHGRGADENDLLGLADALDPERRLHVVTPRAPLTIEGWPGYHWYRVPEVGYPDKGTFDSARAALAEFHDSIWESTGLTPEQTVFGGFSMGAVMSYTMAFDAGRPAVAGVLALSGFIATVDGWAPQLVERSATRVFVAHGRRDQVMHVSFARRAHEALKTAGLDVEYRESEAGHHIDSADVPAAATWLSDTLAARG